MIGAGRRGDRPTSPATAAAAATFPGWLAARTRTTYAERAGRFLGWLAAGGAAGVEGDPLTDSDAFTAAAQDWRCYLLTVAKAAPATANTSLAALVVLGGVPGAGGTGRGSSGGPAGGPRTR